MNIHVQTTQPKFFVHEKQLKEKVIELATHTWQLEQKRTTSFGYAIIAFFGSINPYKK